MELTIKLKSVSIIVPTLNEVENVEPLLEGIFVSGLEVLEVIFVDDGSTDGTADRVHELAERFPLRLLVRASATLGLSGAIVAGARAARGDLLVVMDADLSHPPSGIPDLVRPLQELTCDMVIGSRYVRGGSTPGWPLWRRIMSRTASALAYPLTRVHDSMCGFFAISKPLLLDLAPTATGFKIAFEMIVHGGRHLRVREIPIAFHDRARGTSKMSLQVALTFFLSWLAAVTRRKSKTYLTGAAQAQVR
jgi:dolichol-phosphate mannosyltransferase